MGHYSYPLNDDRERLFDRLQERLGDSASTKADALDIALRHFIEDWDNKESLADELSPELARKLNTSQMKLSYYPRVRGPQK